MESSYFGFIFTVIFVIVLFTLWTLKAKSFFQASGFILYH